jgi:hypothetical protein
MKRVLLAIIATLPLAACETSDGGAATNLPSNPPQYGSTSDIADFRGARAGQAEFGLQGRGYQLVRSQGLTGFWWNQNTQTCASIVTSNGRYQSVTTASRDECGYATNLPSNRPPSGSAGNRVPGRATMAQVEQACVVRLAQTANVSTSAIGVANSTGSTEGSAVFLNFNGRSWVCRADGAGNITGLDLQGNG